MEIIHSIVLPPSRYSAKIVQPCKKSLHFPPPLISPEFTAILCLLFSTVIAVWCDHAYPTLPHFCIQFITVICFITYQSSWTSFEKSAINCFLNQFRFVRRSAVDMYGERKTIAVCNCHDLGPFSSLSFANEKPPFLAPAKVPSMKHSDRSILPRDRKSSARLHKILSITPASPHSWNRLWHVWYGGYRLGRSAHCAPVRNIHKMPLRTSRLSRRGRPFPVVTGIGNNGCIIAHCSSLRSIPFLSKVMDFKVNQRVRKV